MTSGVAWRPDAASIEATNVHRFQREHGIATFAQLVRRSIDEPEWFWDAVVRFLGIPFAEPYASVLDASRGIEWATWFNGGRLNLADACVDRWAREAPDRVAVRWEGEDGTERSWTYAELRVEVDGLAIQLDLEGIGRGDAVGIFLPMLPETVAALLAVMKLGAVFLPLFSGYGPEAISSRLNDAGAKALIFADGTYRRGQTVDMMSTAVRAMEDVPSIVTTVVVPRLAGGRAWNRVPDGPFPTRMVDSEHTLFIAYTSGTTGRPKGSVAVHGGFGVKVAEEVAFQFDVRADDTLFWFTDMGWIMGPWEVAGTLANGATLALYEGAPDWPEPDRLWSFVSGHGVTVLGISPTLIRALMPHGDDVVRRHDLSKLRILGSTGEPWNEDPWHWYLDVVGGGRCPIINISGGTEVGACFLSPHPVEAIKPMSLGGPSLGMAVDVFDDSGRPVRGAVGELVCTKPWPGMTRGLFQDPERYLETYWSMYPGVWRHGDWASIDADGEWFLHGRSDDTIKVAGKRLGPAEVESVLVSHAAVVEAAAVGIPDEVKGEALWCFVVLGADVEVTDELRSSLAALVADRLGKSFRPSAVRFTTALPKTRNAKVLRRAIRSSVLGGDPGDLSALEDPSTLEAVRAAR
ncbi:MAG TPA: AMP-binding protein [Acidimicrobiales bacterium]|nr:AMP-binding protein [Acidimicrobiales bacterium]